MSPPALDGHRADRVHVGYDGAAEGHDALSSRRHGELRLLATFGAARDADDIFTGSPPLAFTFGLGGLLLFPLRAGAATLLLEKTSADALLQAIAANRVTVLFAAPTSYRAMAAQAAQFDLASLRKCVSAGEGLPAATRKLWKETTGIELIDGIGATEMLHIFISHDEYRCPAGCHRQAGCRIPGVRDGRCRPSAVCRKGRSTRGEGADRAAATWRTTASSSTCSTAGTTPGTPTSSTRTAGSSIRRATTA